MRAMARAKLANFNQLTHNYIKNDGVTELYKKNVARECGLFRGRREGAEFPSRPHGLCHTPSTLEKSSG